jgi:tetratricopeptide (TPR) repeat protein
MKIMASIVVFVASTASVNLYARPAPPYCGELYDARIYNRPFDYYNPEDKHMLHLVEIAHFTSSVENLRHGNSGPLGGDLSYVLMIFPNHPRALAAMAKLSLREKTLKPTGSKLSIECFFDRAIRAKPDDGVIRMIYGEYLIKTGRADKATEQLEAAISLQPEDPTINYNLGLLYMQKKDYERAKTYAKKAYELGFPLPGLKNQLIKAGKWEE